MPKKKTEWDSSVLHDPLLTFALNKVLHNNSAEDTPDDREMRIITALERIADALEIIAKEISKND